MNSSIDPGDLENWEEEPINRASFAITSAPSHKAHILEHLNELILSVRSLENKSDTLLEREELTVRQQEDIAEQIDEEVHLFQYKLDHCRRFVRCCGC